MIQILVGILEIGRGNLFGAVVFGTYGPFWVVFGAIELWFAKMAQPAASANAGVGAVPGHVRGRDVLLLPRASLQTDMVLVGVFALIFIGLVFLAIGAETGTVGWTKAGGWVRSPSPCSPGITRPPT